VTRSTSDSIEKRRAELEAQLTELTRRLAESYDGFMLSGPYVLKWARQRGCVRRELERLELETRQKD
jgi:hypothetical protein